ncbi:MAG: hypothetical protein K0R38_4893 [Polyangiaceae bacterium]|jgi:hypothetical protein|nr:hypothetical protein [Polyangiaceae bacterium]
MIDSAVTLPQDYARDLQRVTLAVYERYAEEVVERFGFCPWARAARESGEVVLRVVFSANPDEFNESLDVLGELSRAPDAPDIALLLYPLLDVDRLAFEDFARRLRAHAEHGSPKLDTYAMAAFHPDATADLSHPDKLVPYVRRSPDPSLQLVRNSALSGIKGLTSGTAFLDVSALSAEAFKALAEPPPKALRERIAEQNLLTVTQTGPAVIEAVLADIASDRERAHQALLSSHGRRGPRRP